MSAELDQALKSVSEDEYTAAIFNVAHRQREGVQAEEMLAGLEAEYPGLQAGLNIMRRMAERNGMSRQAIVDLMSGAGIALLGLKEVADLRKLQDTLGDRGTISE